mmetsp:Transcript_28922/g.51652  ORF Transcript_28922/g.51652 Transcript_28922/m.51652 type:complete len:282 (+) Transcript_28922:1027-1872(+)
MWQLLALLSSVLAEDCTSPYQSPIDITGPFVYETPDFEFYLSAQAGAVMYHDGDVLQIDGDFGGLRFNNSWFMSNEIQFRSPSEHTLSGHQMPLEMQVYFNDQYGNFAALVLFYTNSTYEGTFLNQIGFGNPRLKDAEVNTIFEIQSPVDLHELLGDVKKFLFYTGSTTSGDCKANTTWIILPDTLKISESQYENFPSVLRNKIRSQQSMNGRSVKANFDTTKESSKGTEKTDSYTEVDRSAIESLSTGKSEKPVNDAFIIDQKAKYVEDYPDAETSYIDS